MSADSPTTPYGPYAGVYDRTWGAKLPPLVLPALERLLFPHLPAGATLLDLCCGTGRITAALADRGYRMTGLDLSPEMLARARENAPGVPLIEADARDFHLPPVHHAVISTSDSFTHVLSLEDLAAVFTNVFHTLRAGGLFLFDQVPSEGFEPPPHRVQAAIEADHVLVTRESFEAGAGGLRSRVDMTLFHREDGEPPEPQSGWRRWDSTFWYRFYTVEEVGGALESAGFAEVRHYEREHDLGLEGLGKKVYFVARKPG